MSRPRLALGVLCLSLLTIVVDNTIVNVALPTIAGDLGADLADLQWIVDAYTLTFAGLLLLGGALGDRYGRRRALSAGLVLFAVASAVGAMAGSVGVLIGARAVMGAGAALIMPTTLSLITTVFEDRRERRRAVGAWAATAGLGVALGPVTGGLLLGGFAWGSVFLVNVPLCAVALVVGRAVVPEARDPQARPLDWTGAALSGAGLVAIVWAVIEAPAHGWVHGGVLEAFVVGALLLAAFGVQQRRKRDPLLDLGLFRDPRFSAAGVAIMVLFLALFGFLFGATQYLQSVLGYSPLAAGVRVLPYAIAMIAFAGASAAVVARVGTRCAVTTGMLLFAAGLAAAATLGADSGYATLAVAFVLMGAGMGLAGAPATSSIMDALPVERANTGAAVNDTARELGGALGVAVLGSVLTGIAGHGSPAAHPNAFVDALATTSLVAAVVVAAGALAAARWLPARRAVPVRATDVAAPSWVTETQRAGG